MHLNVEKYMWTVFSLFSNAELNELSDTGKKFISQPKLWYEISYMSL